MKSIKDFKLKSTEGFEVKNYRTFPSMEWGENGGMTADIYLNGKKVANVFQEGEGGCACVNYEQNVDTKTLDQLVLDFLIRNDNNYRVGGRYYDTLFKNKVENRRVDDDDYESLVNYFETVYECVASAKKAHKKVNNENTKIVYGSLTYMDEHDFTKMTGCYYALQSEKVTKESIKLLGSQLEKHLKIATKPVSIDNFILVTYPFGTKLEF